MRVIDLHAPMRQKRVKHETLPSWLKYNIILEMELRDYYKKNKMVQYKSKRNCVTDLIRDAKRDYFNSLLQHEKNTKHIWRAINVITNKKKSQQNAIPLSPDTLNSHFLTNPSNLASAQYGEFDDMFILDNACYVSVYDIEHKNTGTPSLSFRTCIDRDLFMWQPALNSKQRGA